MAKLYACGLFETCYKLVMSYLMNRNQRVKIGDNRSDWIDDLKDVPLGSKHGPILFNVFINNISIQLETCTIMPMIILFVAMVMTFRTLKSVMENAIFIDTNWLEDSHMKVNPDKFQAIVLGNKDNVND